ncbi:MAG: hypothetical protein HC802_20900 [Caldilineaceae bacterium]|nr:hypothetical protein [Caldilineaceae bacterium]
MTTTVAPYNERWQIRMRDIPQVEVDGTQNWLAFESDDPDIQPGRLRPFADGFGAIRTSNGLYLERHVIRVEAFDRAGNKTESDEVFVYVRHKPEEE